MSIGDALSVSSERVAWSRSGDQVVVLDLETSAYLSLNGSASVLWARLTEGNAGVDQLAETLTSTFGIPAAVADADAREFVDDLEARGYVNRAAP